MMYGKGWTARFLYVNNISNRPERAPSTERGDPKILWAGCVFDLYWISASQEVPGSPVWPPVGCVEIKGKGVMESASPVSWVGVSVSFVLCCVSSCPLSLVSFHWRPVHFYFWSMFMSVFLLRLLGLLPWQLALHYPLLMEEGVKGTGQTLLPPHHLGSWAWVGVVGHCRDVYWSHKFVSQIFVLLLSGRLEGKDSGRFWNRNRVETRLQPQGGFWFWGPFTSGVKTQKDHKGLFVSCWKWAGSRSPIFPLSEQSGIPSSIDKTKQEQFSYPLDISHFKIWLHLNSSGMAHVCFTFLTRGGFILIGGILSTVQLNESWKKTGPVSLH